MKSWEGRKCVRLALAAYAALSVSQMACAQEATGILRCTISGRSTPIIGAYRHLECRYERTGQATELYSGYTGFTATSIGTDALRSRVFEVFSKRPRSFADLEGRYRLSSRPEADAARQFHLDQTLRGGREDDVLLRPRAEGISPLGYSNAVLGLAQIELSYRLEIGRPQRDQAGD